MNKNIASELIISRTIVYMLNAVLITEIVRVLLLFLNVSRLIGMQLTEVIRNVGYTISFFIAFKCFIKNVRISNIVLIIFFLIEMLISFLLVPSDTSYLLTTIEILFFRCIAIFILCQKVDNLSLLINEFKPYILIASIYAGFRFFGIASSQTNYMVFSYALLFPTIASIYFFFIGRRFYGLIAIFLLMVILVKGARGALLCVVFSFLTGVSFLYVKHSLKNLFVILSVLCCTLVFCSNFEIIMSFLVNVFPDSRSLFLFSNLNLTDNIGSRRVIYDASLSLLNTYLLTGTGVFMDRFYLSLLLGNDAHPHNILLQILLQYGILLGSIIILSLALFIIRGIYYANKKSHFSAMFLVLLTTSVFVHLFVSGSYIIDVPFWMLLGLLNSPISKIKNRKLQ